MTRRSLERGYVLVDVIMSLVLLGLVIASIYQVLTPVLGFSREANDRLSAQQDIRLAIDSVAGQLHETTLASGRLTVYPAEAGCSGAYDGCIGFVTARSDACRGRFQLRNGAPDWQATIYIWRDVASDQLRSRCDPTATFPVSQWPPPTVAPFAVVGRHITMVSFALQPNGSPNPTSVAIALRERTPTAPRFRALATDLFMQTVFVPENR